jgi:hypothetical protein
VTVLAPGQISLSAIAVGTASVFWVAAGNVMKLAQ